MNNQSARIGSLSIKYGLLFGDGYFISWNATLPELCTVGTPKLENFGSGSTLTWKDTLVFKRLKCTLTAWFRTPDFLTSIKIDYHPWGDTGDRKFSYSDKQCLLEDLFGQPVREGLIGEAKYPMKIWDIDDVKMLHYQFADKALFNYLVLRRCEDLGSVYEFWEDVAWLPR